MSFPRRLYLFKAWSKAMEQGASVEHPHYGKTRKRKKASASLKHPRRVRRRKRAKKAQD